MYQSLLVHHANTSRYRPGQEDFTLRVLSSCHADAGLPVVLWESQDDPAGIASPAGLRAAVGAFLHRVLARTPIPALPRPAGAVAPAAGSPIARGVSR